MCLRVVIVTGPCCYVLHSCASGVGLEMSTMHGREGGREGGRERETDGD